MYVGAAGIEVSIVGTHLQCRNIEGWTRDGTGTRGTGNSGPNGSIYSIYYTPYLGRKVQYSTVPHNTIQYGTALRTAETIKRD